MHTLTKAPRCDDMSALFYQRFWLIVASSVVEACLNILNSHGDLGMANHTLIALIPKVIEPSQLTDFQPISLSNVLYKIIAKTLINPFKSILPQIISDEPSAFA